MRFIKKKNLTEREQLLYVPVLHWMFIARPIAIFLLVNIIFYVAWAFVSPQIAHFFKIQIFYLALISFVIFVFILVVQIYVYLTIEYGVTNKRLMIKRGIFRTITMEIPIDRIEGIYCIQKFFGGVFNYGSIYISGVGGMMPVFHMVHKPYALRRKIVEIIEKDKVIRVVHGDLPKIKPKPEPIKPEPVNDDPNLYGRFVVMN